MSWTSLPLTTTETLGWELPDLALGLLQTQALTISPKIVPLLLHVSRGWCQFPPPSPMAKSYPSSSSCASPCLNT